MATKKRFKLMLFILAILVSGLFLASSALAVLIPVGDPSEGNSWGHQFAQFGSGDFNASEIYSDCPAFFEQVVFTGFSDGSWSELSPPPGYSTTEYALAAGYLISPLTGSDRPDWYSPPGTDALYFTISFFGDIQEPFQFDFVAWEGDEDSVTVMEVIHYTWSGGDVYCADCWSYTALPLGTYTEPLAWSSIQSAIIAIPPAVTPVPEPATLLLLGSGLIGLAGFRRKFKK